MSARSQKVCGGLIGSAIYVADRQDFVPSMELLRETDARTGNKSFSEEYYRILVLMGANQVSLHNYEEALGHFLEAYAIVSAKADKGQAVKVMDNIARVYLLKGNYKKAQEYYKQIYEYVRESGDSLSLGVSAGNVAFAAQFTGEVREAARFLQVASTCLKGHTEQMLQVKLLEIKNLQLEKKFQEAERKALELLPFLHDSMYMELRIKVFQELIGIYRSTDEWQKAIDYAEMALLCSAGLETEKELYVFLADAYSRKGQYKKAIAYKDSSIKAMNSLNQIKDKTFLENSRIRLELLKNEKELSVSQARLKIMRILFILSGVTGLILIWAFVNKAAKDKQHKKIVGLQLQREKNDKLLLENKLRKQEALALLEQERLKHTQEKLEYDIEIKNKELTSRALFLANRNRLIGELVNSLADSRTVSVNPRLKADLERLRKQLEGNDDWNNFIIHFEQTNQYFITTLREKHPNLTSNEVRFISLIYINLNTKEISLLLNITPEYCKKKKQQISRKLGLSSAALLYNYLFNFRESSFCREKFLQQEEESYRLIT